MTGRELIAPDGQRINPERLRGLLFRQSLEERRDRTRARNKTKRQLAARVVVVDLATYRLNGVDAS